MKNIGICIFAYFRPKTKLASKIWLDSKEITGINPEHRLIIVNPLFVLHGYNWWIGLINFDSDPDECTQPILTKKFKLVSFLSWNHSFIGSLAVCLRSVWHESKTFAMLRWDDGDFSCNEKIITLIYILYGFIVKKRT